MHLEKMTYCSQRLTNAGETIAGDFFDGEYGRGQTMRMSDILPGLIEFALHILLSHFQVAQGHPDVPVPEQLHQGREADPQSQHLRRKRMSQNVRCHMSSATGALGSLI